MQAPIPPKQLTLHEEHGQTREDYYHWLKDKENPEVIDYLKKENAYTQSMMAPFKTLENTIYEETLSRIQETDQDAPWPYQGYEYYGRTVEGLEYEIFCRRLKGSLEEELLFDENIHAKDKDYFAVGCYELSPDGKWLAITVDDTGDEIYSLWLLNLQTKTLIKNHLENISADLVFSMEEDIFWYLIMDETHRPYQVYCGTVIATPPVIASEAKQSSDEDWIASATPRNDERAEPRNDERAEPRNDERAEPRNNNKLIFTEPDERYWVSIDRTNSDRFLLVSCSSKLTSEVHYVEAHTPKAPLTCFLKRESEHEYDLDHHGDYFYIHSNKNAKNFGLWRCPLQPCPPDQWETVIPHDIQVNLEGFASFKDFLIVSKRIDGLVELWIYPDQGEAYPIPMNESVYSLGLATNWEYETSSFFYSYHSLTTPPSIYSFDTLNRVSTLVKSKPVLGDFRAEDYESKRLHAKASDGALIPISLVYKKDLFQKNMPLYMTGYGAYGADMDPWFSYARLSLLNRGFIFAIAHIRGGGDLGEPWHDAGKLMNKKTTFSDFIDCSKYVISENLTSPEHFFINGGSAGGLLMGAVLNEAPELYRAAVVHVPFVDVLNTMLDETLPLTIHEYEEWGNPQHRPAYDYILSYSPYDNIRTQAYPALFVTGGLNDPRVSYWEPAKWVAKLREHQTAANPILLKIQMSAGHGGLSGRYEALREVAEEFAFVLGMNQNI